MIDYILFQFSFRYGIVALWCKLNFAAEDILYSRGPGFYVTPDHEFQSVLVNDGANTSKHGMVTLPTSFQNHQSH
jgi:hypothetical protein